MSDLMDRIIRERRTEERLRSMDIGDLVYEVHALEDGIDQLIDKNQRLREALTAIREAAEHKAELHPTLLWIADRVNEVMEVSDVD